MMQLRYRNDLRVYAFRIRVVPFQPLFPLRKE
jgi:hypothetical protein